MDKRPWSAAAVRAGRGWVWGVVLAAGIVLLCLAACVVTTFSLPERWEIPEGYRGWVAVTVQKPDCPPLPRRGLARVVAVDQTGRAWTSSSPARGLVRVTYVYVAADGRRTPLPYEDKAYPGVQVWRSGIGGGTDLPYRIEHVFVGTRDEAEHANPLDVLR